MDPIWKMVLVIDCTYAITQADTFTGVLDDVRRRVDTLAIHSNVELVLSPVVLGDDDG